MHLIMKTHRPNRIQTANFIWLYFKDNIGKIEGDGIEVDII